MVTLNNLFGGDTSGVDVGAGAVSTDAGQGALPNLFQQDATKAGDGQAEFKAAEIISGDDPISSAIRGYLAAKGLKSARDAKSRKEVLEAVSSAVEAQQKQASAQKAKMEARKMQIEQDQSQARPILYSNLPVLMSSGDASSESRKKAVLDTFSALYKSDIAQGNLIPMGVAIDANNPDLATISYKTSDGQVHNDSMSIKNTLLGLYPDDAVVQQWAGTGKNASLETVGVMGDDGKITAQFAMRRPDGTFVGADGQTPIDANRIVPIDAFKEQNKDGSGNNLGSLDQQRESFNKLIQAVSPGGSLQNMSNEELVAAQQHILTNPALAQSSEAGPLQQKIQAELSRRSRMTEGYNAPGSTGGFTMNQPETAPAAGGNDQSFIGRAKSTPQDQQGAADLVRSVAPMLALNKMLESGTMKKAASATGIPYIDQYLTQAGLATGLANKETVQYSQAASDARLGMQALVKGVPSNADQAIIDRIVPSESDGQEARKTKINAMLQVTKNLVELNLQALQAQNKQVPPMLQQTAKALGIDPNAPGMSMEELQNMTPEDATRYIMGDYAYNLATGNGGEDGSAESDKGLSDKQKKALELLK